jgi:hypothetical protein
MKEDLIFNIGTKYTGDGFKKANSAMKDTAARAKSASKAIGGIQQALGDVGGEAGKTIGQVGGLVQAFTQLGIAGGIIAAGTMAIEKLFKWLNRTNDALNELAKGFGDRLKSALSKVNAEIAKTNKAFQSDIDKDKVRVERENIVNDSDIAKMEEKKKQALAGKEGVEAAKIELEWTKKIEDLKEAQSKKHLKDVEEEIKKTEANLKAQEAAQTKALQKFKALNQLALDAGNNDNLDPVTKSKWHDDARIAKKEMEQYKKTVEDLKKKLEELATTKLKVKLEAELAPEKKKSALMGAEAKVASEEKKLADKNKPKDKEKEKKDNSAQEEIKRLREVQKNTIKNSNEQLKRLSEAEHQLADKLKDAKSKVANIEADWADNFKVDGGFASWQGQQADEKREAEKQAKKESGNKKRAEEEKGRIAGRIFDRNGNIRKGANLFDIGRFSDINDYLGGDLGPKEERALNKQADKLAKGLFEKDGKTLKKGKENSQEYRAYKQIKGLLDKKDAQYDVALKESELNDIQTQQREIAFNRDAILDGIAGKIDKILEKGGI